MRFCPPEGGIPEKLGGVYAPNSWTKSTIFSTLFITWPKIGYPIYDLTLVKSVPCFSPALKLVTWFWPMLKALWRAFVDGRNANAERVAFSKKYTHFKTRVQKPYPIYD